ncbi:MAG: hypothetical protein Q7U88_16990 [Desulfocapsaceae bacterium]|nr:hypothetical protein [Desulfocapsaceae bacterium]
MMNNNKDSGKLPVMLVVDDDMAQRLLMSETLLENDLECERGGGRCGGAGGFSAYLS